MKIISGSTFVVLFGLSLHSFSAYANEVDDFLGDILSSGVEPEVVEQPQDLKTQEEGLNQVQQSQESLQEQIVEVETVPSVQQEATLIESSIVDTSSLESSANTEEQAKNDIEYTEYEDIAEYYNRNASEDGFFFYELGDGNSTVLQNINIISSPSSSGAEIIKVVNLATDAESEEVLETQANADKVEEVEQVVAPAQRVEVAPTPALNSRTRGR